MTRSRQYGKPLQRILVDCEPAEVAKALRALCETFPASAGTKLKWAKLAEARLRSHGMSLLDEGDN